MQTMAGGLLLETGQNRQLRGRNGRAARAASACGRGGSSARWCRMVLSVPKCVGGYKNGGALFNGACKQLKGPLKAKEPQGATFRY